MDIANIQVEIAESNQKLKNCEKELIECKEKLNECKEKLKECLEAQNNSNNDEYFQNEESTYRRLKDLSPEKRLQTLQDEEKNVSARFTALEQTRAALEQTRAVLQGERLLVLQRSASNSEQGLFMNTEARHKSDQEMDSNLRFTRSGASSRLSYKGKDAIVGLCCPRDQKPSIELKDIEGYEDLWKQAEGDGLEFDEDGAMDDATRRRVKEALRKKFPHSFEQRYFGVSVEFLVQKHVRSLDGVGEMFLH
ncbi:unnamed protein product [Cylindrotheca closterium]|uniref:Uncharacterized protein n=1 Tax=Cylindrotheca closterium TaxID=2856 RepID=A0AAD2FPL3_9STRA|nr:unnamed protein product [Cylindrotheca closterium]